MHNLTSGREDSTRIELSQAETVFNPSGTLPKAGGAGGGAGQSGENPSLPASKPLQRRKGRAPGGFVDFKFVNPDLRGWQDGKDRRARLRERIADAIEAQSPILNIVIEILDYPGLYKDDLDDLSKDPESAIAKYAKIAFAAGEAMNWELFFRRKRPDTGFLNHDERKRLSLAIASVCTHWKQRKTAEILHLRPKSADTWISKFQLQKPPKEQREYIELTQTEKDDLSKEEIERTTYDEAVKRFGKIVAVISAQVKEDKATARNKLIKYGHIGAGARAKILKRAQVRREKVAKIVEEIYRETKSKTAGPIIITTASVAEKMRKNKKYAEIPDWQVRSDLQVLRKQGRFLSCPRLRFREGHGRRKITEKPIRPEEQVITTSLLARLKLDMSISEMESVIELTINEYRNGVVDVGQKSEICAMIKKLAIYNKPLAKTLRQELDNIVKDETEEPAPSPGRENPGGAEKGRKKK